MIMMIMMFVNLIVMMTAMMTMTTRLGISYKRACPSPIPCTRAVISSIEDDTKDDDDDGSDWEDQIKINKEKPSL